MPEDDEQSEGDVGLGRTLALSDGVFAISMTLLAFQIQPPALTNGDVHRLLVHDLAKMSDVYWSTSSALPSSGCCGLSTTACSGISIGRMRC